VLCSNSIFQSKLCGQLVCWSHSSLLQEIALDELFARAFEICSSEVGSCLLFLETASFYLRLLSLNSHGTISGLQIENLVDQSTAGADA
jgi:hypothetical protein